MNPMSYFYPSSTATTTTTARRASAHERAMAIIAGGSQFDRLKAVETTVKLAPQVVVSERDQHQEFETRASAASVFGGCRRRRARDSGSVHRALMADITRGQHQLNHVNAPQVSTDCVVVERKQDQKARFTAQQQEADACLLQALRLRAAATTGSSKVTDNNGSDNNSHRGDARAALRREIAAGAVQLNHVEPNVRYGVVLDSRQTARKASAHRRAMELIRRAGAEGNTQHGLNHVETKVHRGVVLDSRQTACKASAHRRAMELIRRAGAEGNAQHGLNHVETKVHRGVVLDSRQTARKASAHRRAMELITARAENPQHSLNHVQTRVYRTPVVVEGRAAQEAAFRQCQEGRQGSPSKAAAHRRAMELIAGLDSREHLKPVQTREYAAGEPVVVVDSAEQKRNFARAQREAASKELLRSLESEVARLQLNHVNTRVSRDPVVGVLTHATAASMRADDNNNSYRKAGRGWILI